MFRAAASLASKASSGRQIGSGLAWGRNYAAKEIKSGVVARALMPRGVEEPAHFVRVTMRPKKSNAGNTTPFRCMTTVAHPDPSISGVNPTVSPDVGQPQRIKFKRLDKTAKHIMNLLDKEAVNKVNGDREILDIKHGYIIQLKVEVPENKQRVSLLKGIVIARRNAGLNTTFRLRRQVAGVGVESVFPLYSPNIKEMKVLDKKKVRRAKLYYLRDRMNALKK